MAGLMRAMPVPNLAACNLSRLQSAASAYLDAAVEFTRKVLKPAASAKPHRKKAGQPKPSDGQMPLDLSGSPEGKEMEVGRERLRALHWRVDAEVLRLYALPPELERELLDAFDGVTRVGVPFEQTGYIPREFRDVLTLDEFLRITDEWDATEARRCELIERRIKEGRRTPAEEAEFRQLQRLLMLRRRFYSPLPTKEIKALTKRLKEEGEWATVD
jgi:hypothetical protein